MMSHSPPLTQLYQQYRGESSLKSPFDRVLLEFLQDSPVDSSLLEMVITREFSDCCESVFALVNRWQELLVLLLILHEQQLLGAYYPLFIESIDSLSRVNVWEDFQLVAAYRALVALFLDQAVKNFKFIQLPNGAAPIEGGGHWNWGGIPHPHFHAELGCLWLLYSSLTGDSSFLDAAEQLAEWQKNTLDSKFCPFVGLFSHEGDTSEGSLLINNYTLFNVIARMTQKSDMAFLATKQLERLQSIMQAYQGVISPLALVLEKMYASHEKPPEITVSLPSTFSDSDLALVGCRTTVSEFNADAVVTLSGGGSGMGCFHRGDVHVVSFGPQHLPLGDCLGFGVEGISKQCLISLSQSASFSLKGISRLQSHPSLSNGLSGFAHFREGEHSGVWLETNIDFENGDLFIKTKLNSLLDREIAFVFFVKCLYCIADEKEKIHSRSLRHYVGDVCRVDLHGSENSIALEAAQGGKMHVIPLAGGENFWGADFLIAYLCTDEQKQYQWHLGGA